MESKLNDDYKLNIFHLMILHMANIGMMGRAVLLRESIFVVEGLY
jgi:hypothetical protein